MVSEYLIPDGHRVPAKRSDRQQARTAWGSLHANLHVWHHRKSHGSAFDVGMLLSLSGELQDRDYDFNYSVMIFTGLPHHGDL
jgi:hypothetical protein